MRIFTIVKETVSGINMIDEYSVDVDMLTVTLLLLIPLLIFDVLYLISRVRLT